MKQNLFSLFLVLWTGILAVGAQPSLGVRTFRLSNGFTVWINEDHSQPKVFGAVVVKAGAKDCPNTGIAHYFEHIMFKGTRRIGTVDYAAERPWLDSISVQYDLLSHTTDDARRSKIQRHINELSLRAAQYAIPNEFENLISTYGGTGLNAYTSFDETVFHNSFSPQYIAQWCELNSERLIEPVFRLFQGELETVYEEKNMYADMMVVPPAEAAQRVALAGTPYAYPILGSTENLKNPRLSEMADFYHKYYVAGNMGLVLCGDVQSDTLRPLLERTFGRIVAGEAPSPVKSRLASWRGHPTLKVKLPVPIVKASGFGFKAPDEANADRPAFDVMFGLLQNDQHTGLLDSLNNTNRWLRAIAMSYDFKDFSLCGFGAVPNIPLGSKRATDRLLWQQVDRLKHGDISSDRLEMEKRSLIRAHELSLENISKRSQAMINAYSHGLEWDSVLSYPQRVEAVTLADVSRVARKYLNDDSLHVQKAFGRYPKEHVAQPGYKPVAPPHAGQHSAYADSLARVPVAEVAPRLVDFHRDVTSHQLAPLVTLYTVPNPVNRIFNLQLIFRRGVLANRQLAPMARYLNLIGTTHRSRQQLAQALQLQGADLHVSAEGNSVTVTLSGFDSQMEPAMKLLQEFLTHPKADPNRYAKLMKQMKVERRLYAKDNAHQAQMALQWVAYGDSSAFLNRLSVKDMKGISDANLLRLFADEQHVQLDVVYSGSLPDDEVESLVRRYVNIAQVTRPADLRSRSPRSYTKPTVYVLDNPKARQTIISAYLCLGAMPTQRQRSEMALWGSYFGGGMSSVMFQDIREFRSLAYSAHGSRLASDLLGRYRQPVAYMAQLGTQADKSMQALHVLDSILIHLPLRPTNMTAARQHIINRVNNSYPTFRGLGNYVANCRLVGLDADPDGSLVADLSSLQMSDIEQFNRQRVEPVPHVIVVVGDKRQLDFNALRRLGRVEELHLKDIQRR
jgi:predicted Zn-dependent peptidase